MKAIQLKKDERFVLKGRDWSLVVVSTDYSQSVNILPDGSGASLGDGFIMARNEHGMLLSIPHHALVELIQSTEVIQFNLPKLVEIRKAANE